LQFFILLPQWKGFKFEIDFSLFKNIMSYSWPILIVGFGGMINDFLSRITYYKVLPSVPIKQLDHEFGVFAANYKLAALATIFIQVFKMAAEPFFFNQSKEKNAPETYARVTKIFVIICCYIFIAIAMNLDILKLLIASKHKEYAEGINIVPVLTIANIFLGIYYNLAIWYKITNNTLKGAAITIMGVIITIALNIALVPLFHYTGAAWATCACYFFMMVISFFWGQKYYKIPYETLKLLGYLLVVLLMYITYTFITYQFNIHNFYIQIVAFIISILIFTYIVLKYDKQEFTSLPFIGKYLK
jgi:O-antigen/teichoic acid export membrane protein